MKRFLRNYLLVAAACVAVALRAEPEPVAVTTVAPEKFNISFGGFLLNLNQNKTVLPIACSTIKHFTSNLEQNRSAFRF